MDKLKGIHQTDLDSFRIKKTKKLKEKEKEVIDQVQHIGQPTIRRSENNKNLQTFLVYL